MYRNVSMCKVILAGNQDQDNYTSGGLETSYPDKSSQRTGPDPTDHSPLWLLRQSIIPSEAEILAQYLIILSI
ncbi:hypothetical protein BofuT4_uP129830.1 [Botrytis cinerea T4]|uniref:Uncharacterized protein n=1 Tax=Botryotinia fuckeliana (strain T4) TaxID=999810 RepID=G2YRN5_BOTF4|nr:hypothetical protein BofuT4_uP129830.1 [Botrytis cinerea T4]